MRYFGYVCTQLRLSGSKVHHRPLSGPLQTGGTLVFHKDRHQASKAGERLSSYRTAEGGIVRTPAYGAVADLIFSNDCI